MKIARLFEETCTQDISLSLADISKEDCYAIAFYLYRIPNEAFFPGILDRGSVTATIVRLAHRLGRFERLSAVLDTEIAALVKKKKLRPFSALKAEEKTGLRSSIGDDDREDGSVFLVTYPCDRSASHDFADFPELQDCPEVAMNLYRILRLREHKIRQDVISKTFFSKSSRGEEKPLASVPARITKAVHDTKSIGFIVEAHLLSEIETAFLLCQYRWMHTPLWNTLASRKTIFASVMSAAIGCTKKKLSVLIRRSNPLCSFGFIDEGVLDDDLLDCISEQSFRPWFSDLLKPIACKSAYELSSFPVNVQASRMMTRLLQTGDGVSLLLYGSPGSGKTEFAKSLAKASALEPMIFKNEAELELSAETVFGRLNLLLSLDQRDKVLIIDEADTILKTQDFNLFGMRMPSQTKGTVNKMLENCKNNVIWIVNFTSQIEESTLRRFNFSYHFDAMTSEQMRAIATTKLDALKMSDEVKDKILSDLERYSVTGASVDNLVKTVKALGTTSEDELLSGAQMILKENSTLLHGKTKLRDCVTDRYSTAVLNATMSPEKIVQMVQNAERFSQKNHTAENGIRMLFYGLSGTGKTEFARYISQKLHKKLLLKRASDIFGMYVGQNEQNIRDAFREAEQTNSILLFDEADSFFADRAGATHSWERTLVNEFLTQMEEFSGMLICTTNLKNIMDGAMNRRFHLLVEFKPMTTEGIEVMLKTYFGTYDFTAEQIRRLENRHSVTPGDFGSLFGRVRFMDEDEVQSEYIVEELIKIQDNKINENTGSRIGFSL